MVDIQEECTGTNLDTFTIYAVSICTCPASSFSTYTIIVNSGYPGGCAVPRAHPSATSSPLSPPAIVGDSVGIYRENITTATPVTMRTSEDDKGSMSTD